jgi:hypothetical protein
MTASERANHEAKGGIPTVGRAYIEVARRHMADRVGRIKHCVDQLDDSQVWWRPDESMNSIANILLHLCGNLRQWIISGVGNVPDVRDRPGEFSERALIPKFALIARLDAVIAEADTTLAALDEAQLLVPRRVQGFDETVMSTIWESLTHLSGHMQEIIYITRLQLGDRYRFAWTPSTPEQGALERETVTH